MQGDGAIGYKKRRIRRDFSKNSADSPVCLAFREILLHNPSVTLTRDSSLYWGALWRVSATLPLWGRFYRLRFSPLPPRRPVGRPGWVLGGAAFRQRPPKAPSLLTFLADMKVSRRRHDHVTGFCLGDGGWRNLTNSPVCSALRETPPHNPSVTLRVTAPFTGGRFWWFSTPSPLWETFSRLRFFLVTLLGRFPPLHRCGVDSPFTVLPISILSPGGGCARLWEEHM